MTLRAIAQSRTRTLPRFWAILMSAASLARSRKRLAQLDDHILRDIGLTRAQAVAESTRPAWDAQPHWKR